MNSPVFTRRDFSVRLTALLSGLGIAKTAIGRTRTVRAADPAAAEEISRTSEAIHQEVAFAASRERVFRALTDAKQFTQVTTFSMVKNAPPAEISSEAGGKFACFGGYILGRHIELTPNQRIVQAWRTGGWGLGVYSIAKFELMEQGSGTKLVFDHAGFPNGLAEHLAEGWHINYWEPLTKYLAQSQ
jgi:uncharacterized protein YndB with AHSA1/START domain